MKKFLAILVLGLLFFSNVNAEERESELNNLFKQLRNSETSKVFALINNSKEHKFLSFRCNNIKLKNIIEKINVKK